MNDTHGTLDGGIQLRLGSGVARPPRDRLDDTGVDDTAMLVLFYLSPLHRTDQRRALYRALQILDRP
ncbi:MAG: hypothetical protein AB7R89_03520 [Dehalococcoidia bacterium]